MMERELALALETLLNAYHGEGDLKEAEEAGREQLERFRAYENQAVFEEFGPEHTKHNEENR